MSKARQAADRAFMAGRKNLLINGCFRVWQRGTSFTTGTGYTADRFNVNSASGTIKKGSVTYQGVVRPAYIHEPTTEGSASFGPRQRIEDPALFSTKTLTLSALVQTGETTLRVLVRYQPAGTTVLTTVLDDTAVAAPSGLGPFSYTFTMPDLSAVSFDANSFLEVLLIHNSGATSTITTAEMQLEAGPLATEFEHRPIGEEVALCQRYYETGTEATLRVGGLASGTALYYMHYFAVRKRAKPSFTYTVVTGASTSQAVFPDSVVIIGTCDANGKIQLGSMAADAEL